MHNLKRIFPDMSDAYAFAAESAEIKINGQKVLFDKKVSLMPVELKKKEVVNGEQYR